MKEPFSNFVRWQSDSGEAHETEPFNRVWTALRAALRRELQRRDLWNLPPSYLGVSGMARWFDAAESVSQGPGRRDDALEELTADCYSYIFLTRLSSLRAQLKIKHNIEGLVLLSIRSFLLERQRHFDPIGSRVYEVLRSAVRRAIADEICFVQAGDQRIRGNTILAFESGENLNNQRVTDGMATESWLVETALVETAREWADDLLPDLVTAVGRAQRAVEDKISDHLRRLPRRGANHLRFGALASSLKIEVRARWGKIFHRGLGEIAVENEVSVASEDKDLIRLVRSVQPDTSFEERQSFDSLSSQMAVELKQLNADAGTVRYLLRLWGVLRAYALDDESRKKPPSQRQIAAQLQIPRDRLPGLWTILRELMQKHRVAATLLLVMGVGLVTSTGWFMMQRQSDPRTRVETARPDHVPVAFLAAQGLLRGEVVTLELPADGQRFVLVVFLDPAELSDHYRVEVSAIDGLEPIWSSDNVPRDGEAHLGLELSRETLPNGRYILRLHGLEEVSEPAVELTFELVNN